jgi:transposase
MAVDGQGRPLRVIVTPGQRGDVTQAPALLAGLTPRRVLADKAYDANALRQIIAGMNAEAVIPCNPTRKVLIPYDFEAYKARNLIECLDARPPWHERRPGGPGEVLRDQAA